MKKISEDEFREYLEYKEFMNERPAGTMGKKSRKLNLDQLDMVTAARGDQEFASFLNEMKHRKEREEE